MPKDMAPSKARPIGLVTGANLRTPCGPRRVENIRVGDLIVTRDAGLQPVRVIWSRTVSAAELAADPSLAPVRLAPRAIAPMMPAQPVLIAPGHRVLVPGWRLEDRPDGELNLVPASELAGVSDTIHVVRDFGDVTYHSIVFDEQQVFAANGLPVESFLPTPDALGDLDRSVKDDIRAQFPELRTAPETYRAARYPMPDHARYRPDYV